MHPLENFCLGPYDFMFCLSVLSELGTYLGIFQNSLDDNWTNSMTTDQFHSLI